MAVRTWTRRYGELLLSYCRARTACVCLRCAHRIGVLQAAMAFTAEVAATHRVHLELTTPSSIGRCVRVWLRA